MKRPIQARVRHGTDPAGAAQSVLAKGLTNFTTLDLVADPGAGGGTMLC